MRSAFRIIPWNPQAAPGEEGHPLYVPPIQGAGRLDNPDLYSTAYVSSAAAGAVAEVFAALPVWNEAMFRRPDLRRRVLVEFRLHDDRLLDLDDGRPLAKRVIRPSHVVTLDREITQAWARRVFLERRWAGVSWWSRQDSRWSTMGIWKHSALKLHEAPSKLTLDHPAVIEAAGILNRPLV